jgi:adenylate cyclase
MRLRTLLSLILAILLLLTAGFIGGIGYANSHRAIRNATEQKFALANAVSTQEIANFLNDPANRLLDELSVRARRGMLNLKDDKGLGLDLAERLRVNPNLAWISYSDVKTGHFIGVWRTPDNQIVLNTSTPGQGPAKEEIIGKDGSETPYNHRSIDNYDPRERDWFKNALAANGTVWSKPYVFLDNVQGITASRAWVANDNGQPSGVFTVDFYLKDLEALLNNMASKFNGLSAIIEPDGSVVCHSNFTDAPVLTAALGDWVKTDPDFKGKNGMVANHLVKLKIGTANYLVSFDHVATPSGLTCVVAGLVPESTIYDEINHSAGRMAIIAAAAGLAIALILGWIIANRVSDPLRALGDDMAKVGQFKLAAENIPQSHVLEINQLRDASDRMKSGLRSFIKYVPDDVVRQLLSSGKEAVLGGEIRRLTVFFFDIEGFSGHSEQVPPNVLVRELGDYFEVLSRRLRQHSGTIDKYIGDGLLGFFNAPERVAHHENLACRATLIGLQEVALHQQQGRIPFRSRVGLHCGDVLVGNIGTPERFAYTVLGDVVNVASRLENLNKIYGTQIIASGDIWANAGDDFEWRHLDRVSVAGRKGSMDIYELLGLKDGVDEDRLYGRKMYEEALEFYFARSFWDARRIFAQIAERYPHDKAALLMMTRSDHMISRELPADWDGVFVYNLKPGEG